MSALAQPKRVRAGILMRVSSTGQEDGYSLPDQEKHSRQYCAKMGYDILESCVWNDGAQKSYTLDRPGLNAAIEATKAGEIDVLVVARYDRFSRIQLQQAVAIYQIEHQYGGRVESADPKEQFGNDSTGVFLRNVAAWRAETELELIRDRTQRGRKARVQSGKLLASRTPMYGYLWKDPNDRRGKTAYIIDEATAPIVRRIFNDCLAGVAITDIARRLNAESVPSPSQRMREMGVSIPRTYNMVGWNRASVWRMLSHPAYMGKHVAFWRSSLKGPNGEIESRAFRVEDDPDLIHLPESVCPAIVSEEVWQAAQKRLERNRIEASRHNADPKRFLLRGGYAICGYCGRSMIATNKPVKGKAKYFYLCNTNNQLDRCEGGHFGIKQDMLDTVIWQALKIMFREPDTVQILLDGKLADVAQRKDRLQDRLDSAKGVLKNIEKLLRNAKQAVLDADTDDTYAFWNAEVKQLLPQHQDAQAQVEKTRLEIEAQSKAGLYLKTLTAWCRAIGESLDELTYEEQRTFLHVFDVRVTVYRSDHTPRYVLEWDASKLRSPYEGMILPRMTDQDIAEILGDYDRSNCSK